MSILSTKLRNLKDYRNTKDPVMKDKIVVEYAPLVKFIAQKIASKLPANIQIDDLISCGVIGLMDAIDKFDSSRDNKFKTYAEFRIRGAILDELRSQDWVPRSIREKTKVMDKATAKLEKKLGRAPKEKEIADEMGLNQEEFHSLLDKTKHVTVINIDDTAFLSKNDKNNVFNLFDESRTMNPFEAINFKNNQDRIKEGIRALPEKQKLVLSLYYYEELNLKEIGQVLDVTESRVSQLHSQAIKKLKQTLSEDTDLQEDMAV